MRALRRTTDGRMDARQPQLRARVLCVGPGTASGRTPRGFAAPEVPASRYDAASLAEAVRERAAAGRQALPVSVRLARAADVAGRACAKPGRVVDEVLVYATAPSRDRRAGAARGAGRRRARRAHFASPSAVRRFAACLDEASRTPRPRVRDRRDRRRRRPRRSSRLGLPPRSAARARRCARLVEALAQPLRGAATRGGSRHELSDRSHAAPAPQRDAAASGARDAAVARRSRAAALRGRGQRRPRAGRVDARRVPALGRPDRRGGEAGRRISASPR